MAQLTATPDRGIRERQAGDPPCDRLLCYALEGELFFGAEVEVIDGAAVIDDQF